MERPSSRVLYWPSQGVTDDPLIPTKILFLIYLKIKLLLILPNFILADFPPDMNLEFVVLLEVERLDDGDEDWSH